MLLHRGGECISCVQLPTEVDERTHFADAVVRLHTQAGIAIRQQIYDIFTRERISYVYRVCIYVTYVQNSKRRSCSVAHGPRANLRVLFGRAIFGCFLDENVKITSKAYMCTSASVLPIEYIVKPIRLLVGMTCSTSSGALCVFVHDQRKRIFFIRHAIAMPPFFFSSSSSENRIKWQSFYDCGGCIDEIAAETKEGK